MSLKKCIFLLAVFFLNYNITTTVKMREMAIEYCTILCFHHGVRVNLVAIVSSDFYVPSFLVEQSGGNEIFFHLEEIRKIRDNVIL